MKKFDIWNQSRLSAVTASGHEYYEAFYRLRTVIFNLIQDQNPATNWPSDGLWIYLETATTTDLLLELQGKYHADPLLRPLVTTAKHLNEYGLFDLWRYVLELICGLYPLSMDHDNCKTALEIYTLIFSSWCDVWERDIYRFVFCPPGVAVGGLRVALEDEKIEHGDMSIIFNFQKFSTFLTQINPRASFRTLWQIYRFCNLFNLFSTDPALHKRLKARIEIMLQSLGFEKGVTESNTDEQIVFLQECITEGEIADPKSPLHYVKMEVMFCKFSKQEKGRRLEFPLEMLKRFLPSLESKLRDLVQDIGLRFDDLTDLRHRLEQISRSPGYKLKHWEEAIKFEMAWTISYEISQILGEPPLQTPWFCGDPMSIEYSDPVSSGIKCRY